MGLRINAIPALEPFLINPPVWEDLRIPVNAIRLGGAADPDFAVFKTNGAGSTGVSLFWFDPTAEEQVYFAVQLPHSYKLGTPICAHLHWVPKVNSGFGNQVSWGLEYTWVDLNGAFSNTTIIDNDIILGLVGPMFYADTHYITELGDITPPAGAGASVSSMLVCRLFRDATGALGNDTYGDDAGLLEVDFHYQKNTVGSFQEYLKF